MQTQQSFGSLMNLGLARTNRTIATGIHNNSADRVPALCPLFPVKRNSDVLGKDICFLLCFGNRLGTGLLFSSMIVPTGYHNKYCNWQSVENCNCASVSKNKKII